MIRYRLTCEKGHDFEGWFANSGVYEDQAEGGLVICPQCGSATITKAPMAPSVARGQVRDSSARKAADALRRMREHVTRNADYVGDEFAREALRIHHEEAEPRSIYGQATADEADALREEGVEFHPLPSLPEEHN